MNPIDKVICERNELAEEVLESWRSFYMAGAISRIELAEFISPAEGVIDVLSDFCDAVNDMQDE